MWETWHFSPELKERFQQLIAITCPDGPPSSHLYFCNETEMKHKVELAPDEEVSPPDAADEVASQLLHNTVADCSILLSTECIADVLKERPLSIGELSVVAIDQLTALPDVSVLNLCQSVCEAPLSEQNRLCPLVCQQVLLPKVSDRNVPCGRPIIAALKLIAEAFPEEWSTDLLVPVFMSSSSNHSLLESLVAEFGPNNKQTALRSCVESGVSQLQEWQLALLQTTMTPLDDMRVVAQFVSLLSASAHDLVKSIKFGKLLTMVIEQLGPILTPAMKQQLSIVAEGHRSALKGRISKLIRALV